MPKNRIDVPQRVADQLLHANQHTCCLCNEPRQPVEIHHINSDPSDNRASNLAVLCRNCHGLASQTGPLGRRYSPGEIIKSKQEWEARCAAGDVEDEPEHEERRTIVVRAEDHCAWTVPLEEGALLVVGMKSDVPVTATIARESDYRRWENDEETTCLYEEEDALACTLRVEAPRDNRYVFWIANDGDDDATVTFDLSVWSADEDDE